MVSPTKQAEEAQGDMADEAHKALEEASSTLCGLADYCEENFVEGRMGTGGGSSLEETTEFAVKALRAVAFNIGVLAETFEAKLNCLDEEVKALTSEVGWLTLSADIRREMMERRSIRKITVKKQEQQPRAAVTQEKKPSCAMAPYERRPIDYTVLENVGVGGRGQPVDDEITQDDSSSLRFASLKRHTRASVLGSATSLQSLGHVKMPTVPKIQTSSKLEEKDARMKETLRTPSFRRLSLLPPMPDLEEEIKKSSDNEEEATDTPEVDNEIMDELDVVVGQIEDLRKELAGEGLEQ